MAEITFINHASVMISHAGRHLLTDPWYRGSAFHDGWLLLAETPDDQVVALLETVTDIWLSHEHPDHFYPAFFKRHIDQIRARAIPVYFQKTADGRVRKFLQGLGITVIEMAESDWHALAPDFRFRMIKADFYDSALLIEVDGQRVFNLNDCQFGDVAALGRIRKRYGICDVLLTQFSYAAWKGGPDDRSWRAAAAAEKLAGIAQQIAILQPRTVLPFASYVRFANVQNTYLNDAANTPRDVLALPDHAADIVVLAPFETQSLAALAQNADSLAFWDRIYADAPLMPLLTYPVSVPPETLAAGFAAYHARMMAQNAGWLIRLIGRTRLLGGFQPVNFRLIDQNVTVQADLAGNRFGPTHAVPHIALHSASLAFVFANDFGFDTLAVNGCFAETAPGGFLRMAKSLALGNLNSMGMRLSPSLIFNWQFVAIFLEKLGKIGRRLRRAPG